MRKEKEKKRTRNGKKKKKNVPFQETQNLADQHFRLLEKIRKEKEEEKRKTDINREQRKTKVFISFLRHFNKTKKFRKLSKNRKKKQTNLVLSQK